LGSEVTAGKLGDLRTIGGANGTALTTTSQVISFPEGLRWISFTPRNFVTGVVARVLKCPYLLVHVTTDALATAAAATDYSSEAQDADTGTSVTLSSLNTLANGDAMYVGSWEQFRGVDIDVDSTNSTVSTLTVSYWNGSAWADTSDTDGTRTGGNTTFGQDGQVTWSIPSDWAVTTLEDANSLTTRGVYPQQVRDIYWTRWEVSVVLDSSVTLDHMIALNRSTAYSEWLEGQAVEMTLEGTPTNGYAGLEVRIDAGTGNLVVNGAAQRFV
jgi:hypothetical protein